MEPILNAAKAARLLDAGLAVAVDVREPDEYARGHLPGAVLLPLSRLEQQAARVLPQKQQHLLVYCHSGRRSAAACALLRQLGYARVQNLGGILQWPYELEDE